MFGFLIAIEILLSILLIISVLMQSSKGGGLAGTFGGGNVGMMFGVRRTADFLSNATWILATSFVLIALIVNIFFLPRVGATSEESVLQRTAPTTQSSGGQLPTTQPPTQQPEQTPAK
ncbi:MAG: preprotein translocase subunit SecG [Ignavibacteriae bacterium]|nr:preprotein translocase subunit SecG [Ignavibacteriota bacterium]